MGFRMWQVAAIAVAFTSIDAAAREDVAGGPSDPKAKVPLARHESAFATYRYGVEEKSASWKETNELVRRLGGWKAFAADQVPDIPPAPATEASRTPAGTAAPKGGHADHGKR